MDRAQLPSLALLVTVAKRLSFRAAARELGLSPSSLSHAVADLEDRLNLRLLQRTTRSVTLTEVGRRLLTRVEPALLEISDALEEAHSQESHPTGVLRLTLPSLGAEMFMVPLMPAFHRIYPEVTLDLVVDDHLVDIVAEGFDAGIRLGEFLDQDMIALPLGGPLRSVVVAAPSYLTSHPAPVTPDDLAGHLCIGRRFANGAPYRWEFAKDGRALTVSVPSRLILNDSRLVLDAALAGAGLAYCVETRTLPHLASGALVRVLDDWCPTYPGFFLYYPSRRHQRPALRAFIDFVRDHFGKQSFPQLGCDAVPEPGAE
ncbi:LysR substrate-binding domain-containing protein [Telmatospirillum sp.]|uniref:LysR family transcriptional regulator n=1 Tax=Telmatospirillum sp. TaxID=2079197 RepID=UPI0028513B62|nr:LysR substrate-binding domain-containing protein [Telmatospirillum sp.]MDR3438400.1 LysR substrate-binding domain-containing protein [Telmatospirillum sp.]